MGSLHPEPLELPLRLMILVELGVLLGHRGEEGQGVKTGKHSAPTPLAACPGDTFSAQWPRPCSQSTAVQLERDLRPREHLTARASGDVAQTQWVAPMEGRSDNFSY